MSIFEAYSQVVSTAAGPTLRRARKMCIGTDVLDGGDRFWDFLHQIRKEFKRRTGDGCGFAVIGLRADGLPPPGNPLPDVVISIDGCVDLVRGKPLFMGSNQYTIGFEYNKDNPGHPTVVQAQTLQKVVSMLNCEQSPVAVKSGSCNSLKRSTPAAKETQTSAKTWSNTYVVQPGDVLWMIAAKFYGDPSLSGEILAANRESLPQSGALIPGLTLNIPILQSPPRKPAAKVESKRASVNMLTAFRSGETQRKLVDIAGHFFISLSLHGNWKSGSSAVSETAIASLAMALKCFGLTPPALARSTQEAGHVAELISAVKHCVRGPSNGEALTDYGDIKRGADAAAAQTRVLRGIDELDHALLRDRLVVAHGSSGISYGATLTSNGRDYSQYDYCRGGHFILIVGKQGEKYVINDPLSRIGSLLVSRLELVSFLSFSQRESCEPGITGLAIWS